MTDQTKGSAIPPRPNLGPEPFPEPSPSLWPAIFSVLILAVVLVVAVLVRRQKGAIRRGAAKIHPGCRQDFGEPLTSRDRMIALASKVRVALSGRFGPSVLAKTTEELADDPEIGRVLSQAEFDDLIGLLNTIDRMKFSDVGLGNRENWREGELATCEQSVARLTEALKAEVGGEKPKFVPDRVEV